MSTSRQDLIVGLELYAIGIMTFREDIMQRTRSLDSAPVDASRPLRFVCCGFMAAENRPGPEHSLRWEKRSVIIGERCPPLP